MSDTESQVNIKAAVEAILFATGTAIEATKLMAALGTEEEPIGKKEFKAAIDELMSEYEAEDRGIRLIELDGKYQLCTKNDYYDVLAKIVNMPRKHSLTDVLLETLSIVAYKQPVTRAEIEKIRGVSCNHAVNKLVEYNLICEVGRLDAPGHPILFGTTDDFLRCFGISSMDELPDISPDKIEDFRRQAEAEAGIEVPT
ncbi:segregation and condensation protein B [Lachnospiraceae bacterium NE2001]|nr:segregation and condensation protein B [Lachnospiraceae bacterium NE2001]